MSPSVLRALGARWIRADPANAGARGRSRPTRRRSPKRLAHAGGIRASGFTSCPSERLRAAAGSDLQRDPDQRERRRDPRRAARAGQLQRAAHRARGRTQRHRGGRAGARDPRAARHAGGVRRHRAREGRFPLRRRLPGRIRPAQPEAADDDDEAPRPRRQRGRNGNGRPPPEDRHAAARGPGDRGPGRQGPDRHQGRAHHLARLDRGAPPGAHALVASRSASRGASIRTASGAACATW